MTKTCSKLTEVISAKVTDHTEVPECIKNDMEKWEIRPRSLKTPKPIVTKICMGDYVGDPYLMKNVTTIRLPLFDPKCAKILIK